MRLVTLCVMNNRGGVEDTRLKAKTTKKNPRPKPGTALPRTDPLEAKAKDQGHWRKCSQIKTKVFKTIFHAISKKKDL